MHDADMHACSPTARWAPSHDGAFHRGAKPFSASGSHAKQHDSRGVAPVYRQAFEDGSKKANGHYLMGFEQGALSGHAHAN
jgi:hypothetical protein